MKPILLCSLVVIALSFAAGCKAPDQLDSNKPKDSTSKIAKQAGDDD